MIFRAANIANAKNATDKPTIIIAFTTSAITKNTNLIASSKFVKLNTAPAPKLNKPAIWFAIPPISLAISITENIACATKYIPNAINNHFKIGHISAIKCAINNTTRNTGVNILSSRLVIKNKKSKFLIISLTGNVLTVDLHPLSSISFIPKCLALPIPFITINEHCGGINFIIIKFIKSILTIYRRLWVCVIIPI